MIELQAEKNNSLSVQSGKFKDFSTRSSLDILETLVDRQSARTTKRPDSEA